MKCDFCNMKLRTNTKEKGIINVFTMEQAGKEETIFLCKKCMNYTKKFIQKTKTKQNNQQTR